MSVDDTAQLDQKSLLMDAGNVVQKGMHYRPQSRCTDYAHPKAFVKMWDCNGLFDTTS